MSEKSIESLRQALPNCNIYTNKQARDYKSKSWHLLIQKEYEEAEWAARKGIDLNKDLRRIYGNLAHALLFQGKYEAAKAIYLELKDERYYLNKAKTFKSYLLDDFRSLDLSTGQKPNQLRNISHAKDSDS